jgi:hypothetical protein
MWLAAWLADAASAQSCSCSVGTSDATLPMGTVPGANVVQLGLDYGVGQTGGEDWEGVVPAKDLQGNSMAEMSMPGHVVQTARLSGTLGLSHGLSSVMSLPYTYSVPLYPSDMRGDVPRGFLGDVAVTGRWGQRKSATFVGTGLGVTLPTGKVISGVGLRGGRGAVGVVLDASALRMLAPVLGLAGRAAWTQSLYAGKGGYLVGPQLDVALGTRIWTREQGKLSLSALGFYLHRGHDRFGSTVLDQTGVGCLGAGGGVDWRVWSLKTQAVTLSVRGQVPLVQVVGDPWLAENWSVSGGAAFGF